MINHDTRLPQCPNKAEYRYAWGSQIIHGCHQHANAMKIISDAIGASFSAEVDTDGIMGNLQCEQRNDLDDSQPEGVKYKPNKGATT